MDYKLLRWVLLFVVYCTTCQMGNVVPTGAVDNNGNVAKPVVIHGTPSIELDFS